MGMTIVGPSGSLPDPAGLLLDQANSKCEEKQLQGGAKHEDYEEFHHDVPPFCCLNLTLAGDEQEWLHHKPRQTSVIPLGNTKPRSAMTGAFHLEIR